MRAGVRRKQDGNTPKSRLVGTSSRQGGNPGPRSADHHGATVCIDSQSGGSVVSFCGSCEAAVGQDSIGCDRCDNWFHPTSICMGVSERVIDAIREAGGAGVEYVCTQCRARPAGTCKDSPGDPAIAQLFVMVRSLCAAIAKLTDRVDALSSHSSSAMSTPGTSGEELRFSIREEIVEMEERRKRKDSVIFRGVMVESNDDAMSSIVSITRSLLNTAPVMTDLFCIDRNKGLYRVKISDDDTRRKLLMEAKNLRDKPEFNGVYVNRDLTYKQRKELYERRQRNRLAGASVQAASVSSSASSGPRAPLHS